MLTKLKQAHSPRERRGPRTCRRAHESLAVGPSELRSRRSEPGLASSLHACGEQWTRSAHESQVPEPASRYIVGVTIVVLLKSRVLSSSGHSSFIETKPRQRPCANSAPLVGAHAACRPARLRRTLMSHSQSAWPGHQPQDTSLNIYPHGGRPDHGPRLQLNAMRWNAPGHQGHPVTQRRARTSSTTSYR